MQILQPVGFQKFFVFINFLADHQQIPRSSETFQ
jgi:hypothetical protein